MKTIIALLAIALAGCTTVRTFDAPSQNYNLKGESTAITITGHAVNKAQMRTFDSISDTTITISFDGKPQIIGKLDQQLNGELTGDPYKGKKTAATCHGKPVGQNLYDVNCTVFIDNEKTVTLTF